MGTEFEILPQLIMNGLIAGSFYALLAVGLALIYGVMDIQSFAHGSLAILGAYFFWTFHNQLEWHVIPSIVIALGGLLIIGIFIQHAVFMRIRDANSLVSLVATIGVGLIIKNLILIFFGPATRSVTDSTSRHVFFNDLISITDNQIIIMLLAATLMTALFFYLQYTTTGKAIRAVADNKELSAILGISVTRIITVVVIISTLLAGTAGIMAAYDQNLHPTMASFLNIKAFSAVLLGGLGSIPGAVIGAFIIGFAENILIGIPIGGIYLPSVAKDAIAFGVLIIVLYIRPYGIFGMSTESATKASR